MSWIETPKNEFVGSFNLSSLGIDEAYLNYSSSAENLLWLYRVSANCYKCPYTLVKESAISGDNEGHEIKVKTTFPTKFRFRTSGGSEIAPEDNDSWKFCDIDHNFGEFGVYNWHASGSKDSPKCDFVCVAEPVNIYLPLALAAMFYTILLILCYFVGSAVYRHWSKSSRPHPSSSNSGTVNEGFTPSPSPTENTKVEVSPSSESPQSNDADEVKTLVPNSVPTSAQSTTQSAGSRPPQRQRLRSLDTFRGISIVVMIFVNDGGGEYYFFEHATWDGLYVADLVFPWFLWIMGVCIPIAVKSQVKKGTPKLRIFSRIAIRSAKLIGLGLLLNSRYQATTFGEGANLRIPGILQRFGVSYFACATLVLVGMSFNIVKPEGSKIKAALQDIGILWLSWILVLLILLAHTLITFLLEVPGCPKGYLGPGGLHNNNAVPKNCTGGASGYLDLKIFTLDHIYQYPTSKDVYASEVYDPEGFLGSLTSIFQVWLGVQAGATMMVYPRASSRLLRWGSWAVVTGGVGALLCGAQENGGWIPVNKNLWSLSFVLVTTSFSFILLSFLYIVIDIKKWWSGSPFFEPGMNSILLYVGHSVFYLALPWHWRILQMRTHFVKLIEALWGTTLWVITAIWLHHKKKYWSL